ncbi:MAG: hypothetical protein R3B90_02370 [Planctomycetaceae bacterium]
MSATIIARRVDGDRPVRVVIAGTTIASVEPAGEAETPPDVYVAPGFIDLQINGYGGVWFSDAKVTPEAVLGVLEAYPAHGVTRLLPTVITGPLEAMCQGLAAVRQACEREAWAEHMVAGCHVEGPFLSPEDGPRGAHRASTSAPADWPTSRRCSGLRAIGLN